MAQASNSEPTTEAGDTPAHQSRGPAHFPHHQPEHLPVIERARKGLFGDHKPADTVVAVETLAQPGYLIEVDAIAVIDG